VEKNLKEEQLPEAIHMHIHVCMYEHTNTQFFYLLRSIEESEGRAAAGSHENMFI